MFRQAVLRLTLWYLVVILLISSVFSVVLYNSSTAELNTLQSRQESLLRNRLNFFMAPGFEELNQQRINQIEEAKDSIALRLIYFNLIILLAGGAVSYFLAKRTLQPIEDSLEAQKRFTADASHELRTPLTAMKTEIEVALRDHSFNLKQAKDLLGSNLEEIQKLEMLSNGLLSLAKMDTSRKRELQSCSNRKIVQDAVDRVSKAASQRQIETKTEVREIDLEGEPASLVELLTILLDNAIKYSPKDGQILIESHPLNHQVTFRVQDHGLGIKASDLPYIFNRFYRADNSRSKENIHGYGLGLSIAKQIVDSHHGTIEVQSQPGEGSTFIIKLPLTQKNPV